ncbi:c-type cytochrome [Flavihumibacter profundi]|jgi:hypothetical protein|uniref:c-type cytochrome n=1 Tax=Flavihumibacter profundi TaxID=2716883 RepID=UPI001CC3DFCE|nr:diheme cytochrome c-553 [Flavihumibacter profundi]MBZ5859541.1 diheme cytochrome c-553 [Flavihumibacter profundi]
MKTHSLVIGLICSSAFFFASRCTERTHEMQPTAASISSTDFGGYDSPEKWGQHLVTIGGCNDCHTPKKMTEHGLELDSSLTLSGHPEKLPPPDVNRKETEAKGLIVTNDLTTWAGPWGVSFAANLTPDPSGLGNWKEENFFMAIREGKFKGISNSRPLLPPMPWQMLRNMSDNELKAIFAYLKSIPPVKNQVPEFLPPVSSPSPAK